MLNLTGEAEKIRDLTIGLRRDFHRYPELGYQERRTAAIVAEKLNELGIETRTGVAETGVIGLLDSGREGPVVLMRFDMDALPVKEESGAEYQSRNEGVMHACGHDGHTAVGLSIAKILAEHKEALRGKVKFIFQPAEEGLGGAERMVKEGALEDPKPDVCLAMHVWNEKPLGWFGITSGAVMASAEIFRIRVVGRGGHGALPHFAIDPVLASAQMITALQSVVARNVSPLDAAVVSITSIHGGETFNVIPPAVEMQGTIRSMEPKVREVVLKRFEEIVQNTVQGMGCKAEVDMRLLTNSVVNDAEVTRDVQQVAHELFPNAMIDTQHRTMGSEDMSCFMQEIPGCFIFVGSANEAKGFTAPHHHPKFDIDEQALINGAGLLASAASRFLKRE